MRHLSLLLALLTLALAGATLGKHVRNGDARGKPEKVDGVAAGAWGSESEPAETNEFAEEVRGTSYSRLQNLRAQLLDGLPLRLVALGGSSTAGHVLGRDSPLLYYGRLAGWVNESYPHVETLVVNSGTPASGPTYMEKRLYRVHRCGPITCFPWHAPKAPAVAVCGSEGARRGRSSAPLARAFGPRVRPITSHYLPSSCPQVPHLAASARAQPRAGAYYSSQNCLGLSLGSRGQLRASRRVGGRRLRAIAWLGLRVRVKG